MVGRFLTRYYILILLSILCLTGCNSPDSGLLQSNQDSTLKLLYWQAPTILNPHLSNGYKDSEASRITLEPLTSYDKNGEMVLFLAAEVPTVENGGIAADGKSVIWKLKRNVKWADGTPFTAADVVFTYEFITNAAVGSTTANTYKTIKSVEAIDDYTVKVNFKDVNPAWFLVFSGGDGMILPRHLYQDFNGANARQAPANLMPVGTGPYQVVEFKPGDTVVYQPNPNFREADKPYFERVELKGGGDATSAARAVLQTGDGDYAYNLQVEAPVLKRLEAGGKGKVVAIFGALVERILMNQTDPNQQAPSGERSSVKFPHSFFKDKRVRQAFNLALDRETIAQQLYGPTGKATGNFLVLPEQYNSPNTTYEFNPKKAVALLEEAGWKDTNGNGIRDKDGVEMTVLFQTSVNPVRQKTQEIVKQTLTSIGVGVELKSIDASIYFSGDPANTDTNQHFYADLQMYTTGNDSPDPGAYLKTYTCDEISQKANQWSRQNVARYCNPKYDQLWQQSTKELDPEKRRKIFIQMNDLLVKDDVVVLPIVHRADPAGFSNQLEGYDLTPWDRNTWNIMDWKRKS
ncbi:MAG: peptide ABC transporter substrate-binding protein [Moorea sp. SIO4A3]|nr:peptide ABC transporter substrate-binding protein [Moorena sp. SIO4A3]